LVLGYSSGLQIWDCTNLDSIAEILNVTSPEWGRVLQAEVLPNPPPAGDELLNSRPLLGMMCVLFPFASFVLISRRSAKYERQGPDFLVYSLSSHKVVKKLSIPGIVSFSANPNVIVIVRCFPSSCSYPLSFCPRARQVQHRFVSCHLALSCPYLLFLLVFLPLHKHNHPQRPQIPIPPYHHLPKLLLMTSLQEPTPYLHYPTAFLLMRVGPPIL
jgi:hypothetical protein